MDHSAHNRIVSFIWSIAIIRIPKNIFYNIGITTHIWVLINMKTKNCKGSVQLIASPAK